MEEHFKAPTNNIMLKNFFGAPTTIRALGIGLPMPSANLGEKSER